MRNLYRCCSFIAAVFFILTSLAAETWTREPVSILERTQTFTDEKAPSIDAKKTQATESKKIQRPPTKKATPGAVKIKPKLQPKKPKPKNINLAGVNSVSSSATPTIQQSSTTSQQIFDIPKKGIAAQSGNTKERTPPKSLLRNLPQNAVVKAVIEQNLKKTTINFIWPHSVNSAVFVNDGRLWIIFDRSADLQFVDTSQQYLAQGDTPDILLKNIAQMQINDANHGENTFIVADITQDQASQGRLITASQVDNSWIVEISNNAPPKTQNIKLKAVFSKHSSPELELYTGEELSRIIDFIDPFTHQDMVVIPTSSNSSRVKNRRGFVDFTLLETVQGIAIERVADDIKFKPIQNKGFSIFKETGLNITPDVLFARYEDRAYLIMHSSSKVILNTVDFLLHKQSIRPREQELLQKIINAKPSLKSRARIELAMLYFANGLYNEAKTMVQLAKDEDVNLNRRYEIVLLDVAVEFYTGNFQSAKALIETIEIEEIASMHRAELLFWKTIVTCAANKDAKYLVLSNAVQTLSNYENNFLQYYAPHLLIDIGLQLFEYKINANSMVEARKTLAVMKKFHNASTPYVNRMRFAVARYYTKVKDYDSSLRYFDQCISDDSDFLHYNRCQYHRGLLLRDMQLIDDKTLIEILERVQLRWRGGEFEVSVLKKLYSLYLNNNDTVNALRIGQAIVDNYSGTITELETSNNMSKQFIKFFLGKSDIKRDMMDSLEVFFEFNHLLPIGKLGDEVILRVADDLEKLDLLDKQIKLLEHQVKNRLSGFKKQRALNKLAIAYLNNGQPADAIKIMKLGIFDKFVTEEMRNERRYIAAEALCKMGKDSDALRLLQNDFHQRADVIKSNIFWNRKDWKSFNDFSEPYIYNMRSQDFLLNDKQLEMVMKQAISYLNSGEYELLETLYEDFKKRIKSDRYVNSLLLLINMARAQKIKNENSHIFDADEMYKLTGDLIKEINQSGGI